ncbi:protein ABHD18-like [Agrilus planipennis]|uniref:Protein ABHD18-like n=1 Tax=Agrilus planipennis TaxID=224129 RepID=A0A1W4XH87_AGRPL|nr:protein ABHD18-like [Agrilus planipennis]
MPTVSRLDKLYKKMIFHKFFTRGWGDPDCYDKFFEFRKVICKREDAYKLIPIDYPVNIHHEEIESEYHIINGSFKTPLVSFIPEVVPKVVENAYFQLIIPKKWNSEFKPICIHYAATGDHFFWRRRNIMAKPLLKSDIGSIILENPYYGLRKPKDQFRSSLHYVSDILVMGGCLILESLVLLHWCEKMGFGPLGLTGLSMGGHMASLGASNWPKPLVLVPCLSWSTGSSVFTDGVLSEAIDWDLLQRQYCANSKFCEVLSKQLRIVDDPFTKPNCHVDFSTKPSELLNTPHDMVQLLNHRKPEVPYYSSNSTRVKQRISINWPFYNQKISYAALKESFNVKEKNREAVWFMIGVMDEFTHLKNYSAPFDTSLVIAICAKSDGYVPRDGCSRLEDLWPGATVRYLDTGHVGAHIWYGKSFRQAITDAFEKVKRKIRTMSKEAI